MNWQSPKPSASMWRAVTTSCSMASCSSANPPNGWFPQAVTRSTLRSTIPPRLQPSSSREKPSNPTPPGASPMRTRSGLTKTVSLTVRASTSYQGSGISIRPPIVLPSSVLPARNGRPSPRASSRAHLPTNLQNEKPQPFSSISAGRPWVTSSSTASKATASSNSITAKVKPKRSTRTIAKRSTNLRSKPVRAS